MKLLLDQGLPRSAAALLRDGGVDAVHTGDCGLAEAADAVILDYAREEDRIVVTLNSDFHALMVLSDSIEPSVIRIRIEGLRGEALAELLRAVLKRCGDDLAAGALVSVGPWRTRVRRLPIAPLNE